MIKSYVAIGKNNGELVEVTPLWPRHSEDVPLDALDGYSISLTYSTAHDELPWGYRVRFEDDAAVYSPLVLDHLEMLGEL